MKKIVEWLEENEIEYNVHKYGNSYYFDGGFSVNGIQIAFYFDNVGNTTEKEKLLLNFMKRKKNICLRKNRFGSGYTYRIMTAFDAIQLDQHEKAVNEATEKFWKEEHERRMQEEQTV